MRRSKTGRAFKLGTGNISLLKAPSISAEPRRSNSKGSSAQSKKREVLKAPLLESVADLENSIAIAKLSVMTNRIGSSLHLSVDPASNGLSADTAQASLHCPCRGDTP
jgi:hypothetical protein